jgi:hypothetical protein
MTLQHDLERAQREEARWRVLATLNAGRPQAVAETLVLRVLTDIRLPMTPTQLRSELKYLEARKLIQIDRNTPNLWLCELTHLGTDVVEYTVPCNAGIARPER